MNKLKDFLVNIQKTKRDSLSQISSSVLEDRKNVLDLNILVVVDMSGSIGDAQFNQFMLQLNEIKGISRIKVAEYDDQVRALYDFTFLEQGRKIVRQDGSGGNYEPAVFTYIHKLKPDAVLFMTDGYVCSSHVDNRGIPIGYILTANGRKPYNFGEVVITLPPPRSVASTGMKRFNSGKR